MAHPDPLRPKRGDRSIEDVAAAAHDGDGSSVLTELPRDLEADTGASSGEECHLAFEDVGLEGRLHRLPSRDGRLCVRSVKESLGFIPNLMSRGGIWPLKV